MAAALTAAAPNRSLSITGDAAAVLVAENTRGNVPGAEPATVYITNGATNSVYLGGTSAVTDGTNGAGAAATNSGKVLAASTAVEIRLAPGDKLYAFAHTTQTVTLYATGL